MKKLIPFIVAAAVSTSASAYSGAEVVLSGVIGYIVGEKVADRENERQQPIIIYNPNQAPLPYYRYEYRIEPQRPPIYEKVTMYDPQCRCYRNIWVQR